MVAVLKYGAIITREQSEVFNFFHNSVRIGNEKGYRRLAKRRVMLILRSAEVTSRQAFV
jgi:hypothetical protein